MGSLMVGRPKKSRKTESPSAKTIGFRVSGEYGEWLEGLARKYRTTVAGLMDRAIAEWAENEGYEIKPPERMP